MSYETHVTMAINCIKTAIYVYAVIELITVCLAMVTFTAKEITPTNGLSMLFNLWFGVVTLGIVMALRSLLYALFFSDEAKKNINKPVCSLLVHHKNETAIRYEVHKNCNKSIEAAVSILEMILDEEMTKTKDSATGSKPFETTKTTQSPNTQSEHPKDSETSDSSAEERSQADTETETDAKSEIKIMSQ